MALGGYTCYLLSKPKPWKLIYPSDFMYFRSLVFRLTNSIPSEFLTLSLLLQLLALHGLLRVESLAATTKASPEVFLADLPLCLAFF